MGFQLKHRCKKQSWTWKLFEQQFPEILWDDTSKVHKNKNLASIWCLVPKAYNSDMKGYSFV